MSESQKANGNPRVSIVGVGSAGCRMVSKLDTDGRVGLRSVALDTDANTLEQCTTNDVIHLNHQFNQNIELDRLDFSRSRLSLDDRSRLARAFRQADIVIMVAGLGGVTSSKLLLELANASRKTGVVSVALVTTPSCFELPARRELAERILKMLHSAVDVLVSHPTDDVMARCQQPISKGEAFADIDQLIIKNVKALLDLVMSHEEVGPDWVGIKDLLRGAGWSSISTDCEKTREAPVTEIASAILATDSMTSHLGRARRVVIHLSGRANAKFAEIQYIKAMVDELTSSETDVIAKVSKHGHPDADEAHLTILALGSREAQRHDSEGISKLVDDFEEGVSGVRTRDKVRASEAETLLVGDGGLVGNRSLDENIDVIVQGVAKYFGLTVEDLKGERRTSRIVRARHQAMYMLRKHLDLSLTEIGKAIGGRDHSTVVHACSRIEREKPSNPLLAAELQRLDQSLHQAIPKLLEGTS